MALERWQRYRKANPCPICQGFATSKKSGSCKGYLHENRLQAFCQRKRSSHSINVQGLVLYRHDLEAKRLRDQKLKKPPVKGEFLVQEEITYHGVKYLKEELTPFSKTFYVFFRDGEEITRDVSLERIRIFAPHQKILSSEEYQSLQ